MKRAGIIGYPVKHSLSPVIHNHWIAQYGIDALYDAVEITPVNLAADMARLTKDGYRGFSVTIPHKIEIMKLCSSLDDTARIIGAVNTVTVADGILHGTNTDAFGFMENLRTAIPEYAPGKTVVLGAGGAARAVIYALLQAKTPEIVLCNRSMEKACALATESFCGSRVRVVPWDDAKNHLANATLVVNTTSLGMTGQPDLIIDISNAPQECIVSDIVYRPLMTPLLVQAAARGMPFVTGLGMLLHQARPAFRAWFDVMPEITEELIKKIEQAMRNKNS